MKKRVLALVCCLSLTLGLFTYRPPEAKAIIAEASLATSVLWSFMQSAGITLNGTGVNSSSWAEAIEPRLQEFTEWIDPKAASFWSWLGYEAGATGFLKDLTWSVFESPSTVPGYKIHVPAPVAKKFADFTAWFAEKVGLSAGSKPVTIAGSNIKDTVLAGAYRYYKKEGLLSYYEELIKHEIVVACFYPLGFSGASDVYGLFVSDVRPSGSAFCVFTDDYFSEGKWLSPGFYLDNRCGGFTSVSFNSDFTQSFNHGFIKGFCKIGAFSSGIETSEQATSITVAQPGVLSPTYDDSGDKATVLTVPGIEGQVSTINDLLQQILDKLAANELDSSASLAGEAAPDVPATDIGWKGTIEKIYQATLKLSVLLTLP